jgi:CRISPR-associated protein Cpf1
MKDNLEKFIGLYHMDKTLRFELKPIGKTLDNINNNGSIDKDNHRADSYKKVKKLIDRYHKHFIESVLGDFKLDSALLKAYYSLYIQQVKTEKDIKEFDAIQDKLRKSIAEALKKDERFKRIDKKELINKDLNVVLENDDEKILVSEFQGFTSYFTGFHENRKNMYSDEAKSTAIAYRLIHENLPKFIDNIAVFKKVAETSVAANLSTLYKDFEECLNVYNINEMFDLDYYNIVLTQKQIEVYNGIIGGKTLEDGTKVQGLNEYINLYNQQLDDKRASLPKLKPLFKQILSDREQLSWLQEEFKTGGDVLEAVNEYCEEYFANVEEMVKVLLTGIANYDLSKIYIPNDLSLTDISQKVFGNWGIIPNAIEQDFRKRYPKKQKDDEEKYSERISKLIKQERSFSIAYINNCLSELNNADISTYFASLGAVNTPDKQTSSITTEISMYYNQLKPLFDIEYPKEKNLSQDKLTVMQLKNLLDAFKALQRFIKPLLGKGNEAEKDEKFYGELMQLWGIIDEITPLYNKVRNYATHKPYSTDKIKVNFENAQLLDGWDENKEENNAAIILLKDGLYYLGIVKKEHRNILKVDKPMPSNGECYDKVVYKFFKDITTMVPKCTTQMKAVKQHFENSSESYTLFDKKSFNAPVEITKEIFELNNVLYNGVKKFQIEYLRSTNDRAGYEHAVNLWKEFCMQFLRAYKSTAIYDLSSIEKDWAKYTDLSSFYGAVNLLLYNLSYKKVSVEYINKLVEEDKMYLFQIYNKDFSEYSKGTPNMHTLYWKMLFDERNLKDVVYKLNGQAEIFFRKKSISVARPTHPANKPIDNKNVLNKRKQSTFKYDLIKDKRYTLDKFQFHVPITINFKSGGDGKINIDVREHIKDSKDMHFIGIDRGERHLLYLCVINSKGEIVEQYSLNEIVNEYKGNKYHTDYHHLLQERDKKRQEERTSWQTIEGIKELKQGYLSQVIHKISQLIVKYNALVILEDLNMGFKRSRQKVESSVYQQFEKALIDKLNYYVDKKTEPTEDGGLLRAYQLASKFDSFQKMGKQSGFIFYVPAWNTSKIDPVTGFVNLLDTRYESVAKSQKFFNDFDIIKYNEEKDWFELKFDYNKFTKKAEGTKTDWTLCTYGTRIETFRNPEKNANWDSRKINLTEEWKALFDKYNIPLNSNLKDAITQQSSKEFHTCLLHLLKLTLQMRNSETGTDIDYMISPIANEDGKFYDSRLCDKSLPENADANGAYNIARKGLWIAQQIKEAEDLGKVKLAITNKEWLRFVQQKPYLND